MRIALWLAVTHDDDNQTIAKLKFTSPVPHKVTGDAFGNRFFHAELGADAIIRMQFQATRRERIPSAERPPAKAL